MVEAVLQVLQNEPSAYILAVAPSNTAADELCLRLAEAGTSRDVMRRVNWYQRALDTISPKLLPYSYQSSATGAFDLPAADVLCQPRVLVATCFTAGAIALAGVPAGHFSLILLDEAAQPTEPEARVPLMLATSSTTVVLCGDPRQLGPVVRSPLAARHQLGVGLMERLMTLPIYKERPSGRITKLINNYRSHSEILELSSRLFYGGELRSCADVLQVGSLSSWDMLPSENEFPLLFFGVDGKCERADEGSSLYNLAEATQIAQLIEALLAKEDLNVATNDFGVMAPYRKQVLVLRNVLRARKLGAINVGSVDDFQGKEKRIVLISTVISGDITGLVRKLGGGVQKLKCRMGRAGTLVMCGGQKAALEKGRRESHLVRTRTAMTGHDEKGENGTRQNG